MFWWVWTLFRNDRDGVDVKDVCPGPNQIRLDDFEFVVRVGLNRGSDAIFARYVLAHLPYPPSLTPNQIGWRRCRGPTRGLVPVDPPGALRRVGARRKLGISGSGGPTG